MESEEGNKSYTYMYALINLCEQDSLMCFDVLSEGTNKMKYKYLHKYVYSPFGNYRYFLIWSSEDNVVFYPYNCYDAMNLH